jgi:hypothetical protein
VKFVGFLGALKKVIVGVALEGRVAESTNDWVLCASRIDVGFLNWLGLREVERKKRGGSGKTGKIETDSLCG